MRMPVQVESHLRDFGGLILCTSGLIWMFFERQASIVLERYFRFEISLISILCMLIARMEMGTSRVSGDSDRYYYVNYRTFARR